MSSSDGHRASAGTIFVADVVGGAALEFQPENHLAPRTPAPRPDGGVRPIEGYRAGPSPEEIRATCEAELGAAYEQRLAAERAADARAIEALAAGLRADAQEREDRVGRQCVRLALALAERLVRDRIDRDPETIERVVRDAVSQAERVVDIVVFAHPEDAKVLRSHPERLEELRICEVRDDPSQARGGCRLESDDHAWDAGLVAQLARLQDALDTVLEKTR